MNFKQKLVDFLKKETKLKEIQIEIPPDSNFGDYAFPCFQLSKKYKKAPNQIAEDLKEKLKLPNFLEKVESAGPYLNFFINKGLLSKKTISNILKEKDKYGSIKSKKETVMVEFSQANTHKAFHVGHIRGTTLGESLARILSSAGKKVIRANYQGDTGMHVAKWIWCYQKYHKEPLKKEEAWIASIYVDAVKRLTAKPELQEEVDEINKKLDSKEDKKLNKLWKDTRKSSLDAFEVIYSDLNTKFDNYFFEGSLEEEGKQISKELTEKNIAEISDEATIINLEKYNLGVWVLLRKDGTVLYSAKDLALAKRKFEDFKVDTSIYVVGKEQEHHFMQLFKTLDLMKFKQANNCRYVPVSLVKLPWGKMSSRTGDNILYSEFKKELTDYAKEEIKKRHEKMTEKELENRALAISIASMKYTMLKQSPNKEIVFDKKEALNFEGDTGPYIQYTHARASSILAKTKANSKDIDFNLLTEWSEINLIKHLNTFPIIIQSAADQLKPNIIANYTYSLAQAFTEFYHNCPVKDSEPKLKATRIALVKATKQVIKNSLGLLGIEAPEQM